MGPSRFRLQGRAMFLWTLLSYREATIGIESVPLFMSGRVREPLPVATWESRGSRSPPPCRFQKAMGMGGWVSFSGADMWQWIIPVFLWASVLPSIAWGLCTH